MSSNFEFQPLRIPDLVLIHCKQFADDRGSFSEKFKASDFKAAGLPHEFLQQNLSYSKKGVVRGLHFQKGEFAQGKLVTVLKGRVKDVAVDMRKDSPTYLKYETVILDAAEGASFYVPAGFAHGFSVLSDEAIFTYACTTEYNKGSEFGIRYDDPELAIDWEVEQPIVSEKDLLLPYLKDHPER